MRKTKFSHKPPRTSYPEGGDMSSIEVLDLFRDSTFPKTWPCGKMISSQLIMTKSPRGGDNPIDLKTREIQDEGLGIPPVGKNPSSLKVF